MPNYKEIESVILNKNIEQINIKDRFPPNSKPEPLDGIDFILDADFQWIEQNLRYIPGGEISPLVVKSNQLGLNWIYDKTAPLGNKIREKHILTLKSNTFISAAHFPPNYKSVEVWTLSNSCECKVEDGICDHFKIVFNRNFDALLYGTLGVNMSFVTYVPFISYDNIVIGAMVLISPNDSEDNSEVELTLLCHGGGVSQAEAAGNQNHPVHTKMGAIPPWMCTNSVIAKMIVDTCRYILDVTEAPWPCGFCGAEATKSNYSTLPTNNISLLSACAIVASGECIDCITTTKNQKLNPDVLIPQVE